MDRTAHPLDPEQLRALARAHYHAARWDEALGAIAQLQALGAGSPELDDLTTEIRFKQRLDAALPPETRAPQPRHGAALPALGALGGLAILAALAMALAPLLPGAGGPPPAPPALAQSVAGALPATAPREPTATAAPTATQGSASATVAALPASIVEPGARNLYLILDASGSMLARVEGRRKIDTAREVLAALLRDLPDGTGAALRTYGRRRPDDCADVELLAAPGPLAAEALAAQIGMIEPINYGRTPIAASLEAATADLAGVAGQTLVILVSDGEESCGGDPVAAAAALRAARPDVRVSVVGFDIAPVHRERLAAIAEAGGGSYVDAGSAGALRAALEAPGHP